MNKKFGIIIHAGAGPDSEFIRSHESEILAGLEDARNAGYHVLEKKGSAVDAVEAAVRSLEDNLLFNAGRGAGLNNLGKVEMCTSIMNGKDLSAGAVAVVNGVKNPVSLARKVMEAGVCVYLTGESAVRLFGKEMEMMPESYFVTDHQVEHFLREKEKALSKGQQFNECLHGTVGAVAIDMKQHIAAATSTGGTSFSVPGRIGDSSMIGVGTYANDQICGISCTGDGEHLIRHVAAHSLASIIEYDKLGAMQAAELLVKKRLKHISGDLGVICIDHEGEFGLSFNSERMPRSWKSSAGSAGTEIYS